MARQKEEASLWTRINKRQAKKLLEDPGFKGEVIALPCKEAMTTCAPHQIHLSRDMIANNYSFDQCVKDETDYNCHGNAGSYLAFYLNQRQAKALA